MADRALDFGKTLNFTDGQTIYEEGQEADGVYLITEGRVDLWRTVDHAFSFLATFDQGQIFGEASVIKRTTRSTTVRANGNARVLFIEADDFHKSIKDPLIKHLVTSMADRLRERYVPKRELIQESDILLAGRKKVKKKKHTGEVWVEGVSPMTVQVMAGKVKVANYPFVFGNTRAQGDMARLSDFNLMMPLPMATDLASQHFELIKRGSDIVVRDLGSKNGTVVNGELIKRYDKISEIPLEVGENTISTGGLKSKVTFLAILPEVQE